MIRIELTAAGIRPSKIGMLNAPVDVRGPANAGKVRAWISLLIYEA